MTEQKANATSFQSLEELRQIEALFQASKITVVYRQNKVSASCKIQGWNFSGTGKTRSEAFTQLECNVLTRKN